jgi:hypothetical protein
MSLAAQVFASEAEAVMFRARVPSGSLSHLSGNRFAAPGENDISFGSVRMVEKAHNALLLAVLISLVPFVRERSGLLDFINGLDDIGL